MSAGAFSNKEHVLPKCWGGWSCWAASERNLRDYPCQLCGNEARCYSKGSRTKQCKMEFTCARPIECGKYAGQKMNMCVTCVARHSDRYYAKWGGKCKGPACSYARDHAWDSVVCTTLDPFSDGDDSDASDEDATVLAIQDRAGDPPPAPQQKVSGVATRPSPLPPPAPQQKVSVAARPATHNAELQDLREQMAVLEQRIAALEAGRNVVHGEVVVGPVTAPDPAQALQKVPLQAPPGLGLGSGSSSSDARAIV
jgi:hypothetical protein